MSKREIIRRMTPGRLAWLTLLRDHGPHVRGRGTVGYQCMRLGWTEWDFRRPDGAPITAEQAHAEYGDGWWGHVSNVGERITDAGRSALAVEGREDE
ncbi:hypothetical protein FF80_03295 [Devosia sp. LC5]|nr:hypothetical protein FF80_03295 [Devosia sp. LC5]